MASRKLLTDIARTTAAAKEAERKRVAAIRAAKESKEFEAREFTVDQIAAAAGITRDAVYKMLARVE
jgi:hypothetical protein